MNLFFSSYNKSNFRQSNQKKEKGKYGETFVSHVPGDKDTDSGNSNGEYVDYEEVK